MKTATRSFFTLLAACLLSAAAHAGVQFKVTLDPAVSDKPVSGRVIVMLIKSDSQVKGQTFPADGPFFDEPQPMYGIDVKDLAPGASVIVDDACFGFPTRPSKLLGGIYKVQARLDTNRQSSQWRRDAGNFYSEPATLRNDQSKTDIETFELKLTGVTKAAAPQKVEGVELFEMKSALLSKFRGSDVTLRAAVVFPVGYDAGRSYAAVYEIPGYGGDHEDAYRHARGARASKAGTPAGDVARNSFWIVLDPEGPYGHTLFADSANNGPCGQALVSEFIPALEAKYKLVAKPSARLLRGHSSGGWSSLWLAVTYPDVFGATWSSSPDPVDFRAMQLIDIYSRENMYREKLLPGPPAVAGDDTPSYRQAGRPKMSIRQENWMEEALGPNNTSAQQWDSWFAVWGPRDPKGFPTALFDPVTGTIDKAVAEKYRAYDIADRLRKAPDKLGPIFKQRIRLVVGDLDSYYLEGAVKLLKAEVDKLNISELPEGARGKIEIVPNADHGSVFMSPAIQAFPADMLDHLKRNGLAK